jgi:hypothetical protein
VSEHNSSDNKDKLTPIILVIAVNPTDSMNSTDSMNCAEFKHGGVREIMKRWNRASALSEEDSFHISFQVVDECRNAMIRIAAWVTLPHGNVDVAS